MIISHSRKFIVFSNPKTGSESLRKLFAPWSEVPIVPYRSRDAGRPFYPHMPPTEVAQVFEGMGWDFDSYMRITVVRNPYDRLVSLYRMIAEVDRLWLTRRGLGLGQTPFPVWLSRTAVNGRGGGGRDYQRWRKFGTWSAEYWCAGLTTHVLRLEHLESDLMPVLSALNLAPGVLPQVNRRPRVDVASYYDDRSLAQVARRYAYDLRTFGYVAPSSALLVA